MLDSLARLGVEISSDCLLVQFLLWQLVTVTSCHYWNHSNQNSQLKPHLNSLDRMLQRFFFVILGDVAVIGDLGDTTGISCVEDRLEEGGLSTLK